MIEVSNLCVAFGHRSPVINNVSFNVPRGRLLAIVGESGSGKTTLCRALTRLFLTGTDVRLNGKVIFANTELLSCATTTLLDVRRKAIRYVFQEPHAALNPVARISKQLALANSTSTFSDESLSSLLSSLGFSRPAEVLPLYPHQLSIGMAQRIAIAMALLARPSLLIADEPTSALDATLRRQLLDLLKSFQEQTHMTMILVTHDIALAIRYADDILVLKDGRIVDKGATETFCTTQRHPYTQLLLNTLHTPEK